MNSEKKEREFEEVYTSQIHAQSQATPGDYPGNHYSFVSKPAILSPGPAIRLFLDGVLILLAGQYLSDLL